MSKILLIGIAGILLIAIIVVIIAAVISTKNKD
jgi:hypothetical protein